MASCYPSELRPLSTLPTESMNPTEMFYNQLTVTSRKLPCSLTLTGKSVVTSPSQLWPELGEKETFLPTLWFLPGKVDHNYGENPRDFAFFFQATRLSSAQEYKTLCPQTYLSCPLQFRTSKPVICSHSARFVWPVLLFCAKAHQEKG